MSKRKNTDFDKWADSPEGRQAITALADRMESGAGLAKATAEFFFKEGQKYLVQTIDLDITAEEAEEEHWLEAAISKAINY